MRRFALAAVALAAIAVAGCSSSSSSSTASGSSSSSAPAASSSAAQTGTITVFAASSLKDTFTQLGKQFETAHPGDTVKFNFGASSALGALSSTFCGMISRRSRTSLIYRHTA